MKQNRKPRNGLTTIWSTHLQNRKEYPMEKKDRLFNTWCWENWATTWRMKPDHFLIPHTRNWKWMKHLNVRQETIKIIEEKEGNNLFDLSCSNFLLDMSPKAWKLKVKMSYWDFIKIKSFCTAKETINKTKRQPMEWKKILVWKWHIRQSAS